MGHRGVGRGDGGRVAREPGSGPAGEAAPDRGAGPRPLGPAVRRPSGDRRGPRACRCPRGPASDAPGPTVRVAGRIMLRRGQGKVNFLELRDWTDRIQIFVGKNAGRRGRLEPGRRARPGRPDRRRRHARPDQDRRADRLRHRADVPGQEPAAAPREVARPDRRRAALPAAVRRPVQQPRVAGDLPGPVEDHRRVPQD